MVPKCKKYGTFDIAIFISTDTAQMKFSIKDFFNELDEIGSLLWI